MVKRFRVLDPEAVIEHEPHGLDGAGAITLSFGGVKFRFTLEDAETIGEKMVECVRNAEASTPVKRRK